MILKPEHGATLAYQSFRKYDTRFGCQYDDTKRHRIAGLSGTTAVVVLLLCETLCPPQE